MFWDKGNNEEHEQPEGWEPDNDDEAEILRFEVRTPEDLEKLPKEALRPLVHHLMMQMGRMSHEARHLCLDQTVRFASLYATALDNDADQVAEYLRAGIDAIGRFLASNGLIEAAAFEATVDVSVELSQGKVKEGPDAIARFEALLEQHRAKAGTRPENGSETGDEADRLRAAAKAFDRAFGDLFRGGGHGDH